VLYKFVILLSNIETTYET